MNEMKPISNFRNNLYQVAIILLLAYAAFSTAMKDLDRLQELAGNVQSATANGLGGLASVYSTTKSLAEGPEIAQAPKTNALAEAPRVNIAAGGSVALAGLDENSKPGLRSNKLFANEKAHSALACPLSKREMPKAVDQELNWKVVAQMPQRMELLRHEFAGNPDPRVATMIRRGPRVRAIINKVPVKPGNEDWSNVGEFKSLSDVIGFGLKAAQVEAAETERKVETTEEATRYLFEFKRTTADSEREDLATHQ
jgi:Arc/MetJ-type ribon-helix-helix transcriptional regulator